MKFFIFIIPFSMLGMLSACSLMEDLSYACIESNPYRQAECLKRNNQLLKEREERRKREEEDKRMEEERQQDIAFANQRLEKYYASVAAAKEPSSNPRGPDTRKKTVAPNLKAWKSRIFLDIPDRTSLDDLLRWGENNAIAIQYGDTISEVQMLLAYQQKSAMVRRFVKCECQHCVHQEEKAIIATFFMDRFKRLNVKQNRIETGGSGFCGNKRLQ